jgi:NADP-dependent aldehyde dehydrogenase
VPASIHRYAASHSSDKVRQDRLPPELGDANPGGVQRCIDGIWTTADIGSGA